LFTSVIGGATGVSRFMESIRWQLIPRSIWKFSVAVSLCVAMHFMPIAIVPCPKGRVICNISTIKLRPCMAFFGHGVNHIDVLFLAFSIEVRDK
jgi:hypothetical protein